MSALFQKTKRMRMPNRVFVKTTDIFFDIRAIFNIFKLFHFKEIL